MLDWRGQRCAVCGSGSLERQLLRIDAPDRFERYVGIAAEGYERYWVECSGCGAATNVQSPANRQKLEAVAAGYYEIDLAGSSVAEKYARVMALAAESSDNAQRALRIQRFLRARQQTHGRVLDVGSGTGVFLSRFLDLEPSWAGTAVEPDAQAAQHLRTLGKFEVIEGLFDRNLRLGRFQLVTLNKVVEHLPEPVHLVSDAMHALADHGVLYLELPDKRTALERPTSDNILGALHCHLYDTSSVATLFKRVGLAPLHIEQISEPSGKISVYAFASRP